MSSDLTSAITTIQNLCSEITEDAIKDCTRLSKYKPSSNRPILVKLVRSHDASSILANRYKIPARSSYTIKPLMTAEERANELKLLRERRTLIDSGIERRNIKLKQNAIYVNGKKYGYATPTGFQRCTQMPINSSSAETTSQDNVEQAQNQQVQQANEQLANANCENSDHSLQILNNPINIHNDQTNNRKIVH